MSTPSSTIPKCFEKLVTLRGVCDDVIPTSGLYFNDCGISMDELDEYATKDFLNGADLFARKFDFEIESLANQIHAYLQPMYKARSVIENMRVGFYQDDLIQIPAIANNLRLMQFEFINNDSFIDLEVSEIALQLNYNGNVDISVFDLLQNKLIDTIPVACKPNEVSYVYPNKRYKSSRKKMNLIFCYDSTGKTSNTAYLTRSGGNCGGCTGKYYFENQYVRITPGKILSTDSKINKNIVPLSDTGGMSIVYSLSCNHKDWLCSIANTIALPAIWKTAAAIMEHALLVVPGEQMTPRTQGSHILKVRYDLYMDKFKETFDNAVKNIVLPSDEKCFVCNNRIRTTFMIPS